MKKTYLFLLFMLLGTIYANAAVFKTINVSTAGDLSSLLTSTEKTTITDFTITGDIDARDVKCMRDEMTVLAVLDISAVSVAAFTGVGTNGTKSYSAGEIPDYSFCYPTTNRGKRTLNTITLPLSITSIGERAFNDCYGLSGSLTIPNSVTSIGEAAFYNCFGFTGNLIIPNSVSSIGIDAFRNCDYFTGNLTIPNSVTSIGRNAFGSCVGFTGSLTIGSSVTSIGEGAFQYCSGLKIIYSLNETPPILITNTFESPAIVYVPNTVVTAYKSATGWNALTIATERRVSINNVTAGGLVNEIAGLQQLHSVSHLTVTGNLNSVDIEAMRTDMTVLTEVDMSGATLENNEVPSGGFQNKKTLALMKLPSTVTKIGAWAFRGCSALSGTLPIGDAVTSIQTQAFEDCSSLTGNISLPSGLLTLGSYAFSGCRRLTGSLIIPNSVTSIGSHAFYACSGLTALTLPSSITVLNDNAFNNCLNISGVLDIPLSVTSIGSSAFYGCNKLTELKISKNTSTIGDNAFYGCSGLTKIPVPRSTPPTIYANTFGGVGAFTPVNKVSCVLEVPKGAKSTYEAANYWKDFTNIVEVDNVTDHYRSIASSNWDVSTTWESSGDGINGWAATLLTPTSTAATISIMDGHLVTVASDATASTLTVNPGAKLTLYAGKKLTANTLTLQSNASGTGTFVDNGGTLTATTTNVKQYLTSGRNWYISSPMSGASSTVFTATGANPLYYYVEPNGSNAATRWAQITTAGTALSPTTGYIANMNATVLTNQGNLITFTGGNINTGNITTGQNGVPSLTRTAGQQKEGFNLVGNPYPSYLNWSSVVRTQVDPTMWYRTKVGTVYKYYTYLPGTGALDENGVSVPAGVTNLIPPMQAFWVRVSTGQSTGSLGFTNNMRAHKDEATNILRAPAATKSARQLVRLQVSNGVNDDETVIYFNSNASNGFDTYDAPKMSNDNNAIPEIYSTVGQEQLVINGMNAIPFNTELPLGFMTGQTNSFTLKATEINNLDKGTELILKDKKLNVEQELAVNVPYAFTSDVVNTVDRFSLIFRTKSVISAIENFENASSALVYSNENSQIVVNFRNGVNDNTRVEIYNAVGQKLVSQSLKSTITVINNPLVKGVYMVTLINDAKSSTQKVILK